MSKTRNYKFDKIEICRNCLGMGVVDSLLPFTTKQCPVCEGSGRVEKHTEITITVKPYGTEKKQ